MTLKKLIGKLHLWLGLTSGLIVFIVSITGCIFTFEEELFSIFHTKLVHIQPPPDAATPLPVSTLEGIAQKALGNDDTITIANIYPEKNRAWEFDAFKRSAEESKNSFWVHADLNWKKLYINPYSGKVNGVFDMKHEFFTVVRAIHQSLYINYEVGSKIVGTATIIFILMLLSGLFLWWPKNKSAARQRYAFRWKKTTKWKRKNYDLHNILGFYILIFALFIAITGIVWSFDWWEKTVFRMFDGEISKYQPPKNPNPIADANASSHILDVVTQKLQKEHPDYYRIFLSKNRQTNTLNAGANYKDNTLWTPFSYYQFDLSTGKQFGSLLQENKTTGQKWRNSNYDLHTGKSFGYLGMTIAFLTALIIASLPITGFLVWWGRRKKSKSKSWQIVKPQHVRIKEIT